MSGHSASSIETLYGLFGVKPTCSDAELRGAFCQQLLKIHPDINQEDQDATQKTQHIIDTYEELKIYRLQGIRKPTTSGGERKTTVSDVTVTYADIREVATKRKTKFRTAWEQFQGEPFNPLRALLFIHAAFEAERANSGILKSLLADPILINSASALLSENDNLIVRQARCTTLIRWAQFLQDTSQSSDAIQILEDVFGSGLASPDLKETLRSFHYRAAQGPNPSTGAKPSPESRIEHLERLIKLGYGYDYIHKQLAEACHDIGDDERARAYLKLAYKINPTLVGAVRITRTLSLNQKMADAQPKQVITTKAKWTNPRLIPSPPQIRVWAENQQWDSVLDFADPGEYSHSVLPRARDTLRVIAISLARCTQPSAKNALIKLLQFKYYFDVAEAAAVSLSKIGDDDALSLLAKFGAQDWNASGKLFVLNSLDYLQSRINQPNSTISIDKSSLLCRAKLEIQKRNFGRARFLLENFVKGMDQGNPDFVEATVLCARSCAEMNDAECAIELVKPVLANLRASSDRETLTDVGNWLWRMIISEEYDESLDSIYQWALDLNLDLVSQATMPEHALGPLRNVTRAIMLDLTD